MLFRLTGTLKPKPQSQLTSPAITVVTNKRTTASSHQPMHTTPCYLRHKPPFFSHSMYLLLLYPTSPHHSPSACSNNLKQPTTIIPEFPPGGTKYTDHNEWFRFTYPTLQVYITQHITSPPSWMNLPSQPSRPSIYLSIIHQWSLQDENQPVSVRAPVCSGLSRKKCHRHTNFPTSSYGVVSARVWALFVVFPWPSYHKLPMIYSILFYIHFIFLYIFFSFFLSSLLLTFFHLRHARRRRQRRGNTSISRRVFGSSDGKKVPRERNSKSSVTFNMDYRVLRRHQKACR